MVAIAHTHAWLIAERRMVRLVEMGPSAPSMPGRVVVTIDGRPQELRRDDVILFRSSGLRDVAGHEIVEGDYIEWIEEDPDGAPVRAFVAVADDRFMADGLPLEEITSPITIIGHALGA